MMYRHSTRRPAIIISLYNRLGIRSLSILLVTMG